MFGNVSSKLFLRICALNWKPWITMDQSVNETKLSGPMANVIENLSQLMNFRYEIYMPEDKHWGMEYPDGTWSGMIGMLHNNEADVALGPFATTYARSKVATFTSNLATGYLAVMAGRMKRKTTNVFGYILTFDWQVWFVLIIAMLVMVSLSFFVNTITDPKYRSKPMIRKQIGEYIWLFYSSIFCEASPKLPNTISGRLLVAVWWLGIIVLMNAFSGHMKASMMVKADFDRIDSLKDLALKSTVVPLVWKGTAYESYLEKSTSTDIKRIWKRVYENNGLLLPSELYRQENLKALQKGTNVIISDVITMRYIVSNECSKLPEGEFYFAKETFFPHTFVMAVRKKLPKRIQNGINKRIRWMVEAGMVDKWLDQMNGDLDRCLDQDGGDRARALAVEDLWAIFILWAICVAIATTAFVFELLFYKLRNVSENKLQRI